MYREVLFELADGRPATALFEALAQDKSARARLQALSVSHDVVTVLIDYAGPPASVARLRDVIARRQEPITNFDIMLDEDKHIRFIATWKRPPVGHPGVSLEHVLHDTVGPGGLLFGRVTGGIIAYKAAAPGGVGLTDFLAASQAAFGRRYEVRPIRAGPFKPGWEIEDAPRRVDPDEEALLSAALAAGYYDEPKRCGVRELGDALGVSKSVIARRLRILERRALEALVH